MYFSDQGYEILRLPARTVLYRPEEAVKAVRNARKQVKKSDYRRRAERREALKLGHLIKSTHCGLSSTLNEMSRVFDEINERAAAERARMDRENELREMVSNELRATYGTSKDAVTAILRQPKRFLKSTDMEELRRHFPTLKQVSDHSIFTRTRAIDIQTEYSEMMSIVEAEFDIKHEETTEVDTGCRTIW